MAFKPFRKGFVPDPFLSVELLYRTGQAVNYLKGRPLEIFDQLDSVFHAFPGDGPGFDLIGGDVIDPFAGEIQELQDEGQPLAVAVKFAEDGVDDLQDSGKSGIGGGAALMIFILYCCRLKNSYQVHFCFIRRGIFFNGLAAGRVGVCFFV